MEGDHRRRKSHKNRLVASLSLRITRLSIITGHVKSICTVEHCKYQVVQPHYRYLICIKLSFLAETWRHVLGLDLLLGHVVLVLVEEMLVLNLFKDTRELMRRRQTVKYSDLLI